MLRDELFQGQQRSVRAVLHDLGVAEAGVEEDVRKLVTREHEVLLLGVDLLRQVAPVDRDVRVRFPLLDELHGGVVGSKRGLGPAERERQRLGDDGKTVGVEAVVG
ncbi:hypothetical protein ACFPRL_28700 [Pseudoclavibacter helvolus]